MMGDGGGMGDGVWVMGDGCARVRNIRCAVTMHMLS
jgi:hypothetical protein